MAVGGPVLGLDGRVVAVNVAILPEFGGSNMGVPAAYAQQLLTRAATSQSVSSSRRVGSARVTWFPAR